MHKIKNENIFYPKSKAIRQATRQSMRHMKTIKYLFRNKVSGNNTSYEIVDLRGFTYVPKYTNYLFQNTKKAYLILDQTKISDHVMLELISQLVTLEDGYVCIVTENLCSNLSLVAMFANEIIYTLSGAQFSVPNGDLMRYLQDRLSNHNREYTTSLIKDLSYSRKISELEKQMFGFERVSPLVVPKKRFRTLRKGSVLGFKKKSSPPKPVLRTSDFHVLEEESPSLPTPPITASPDLRKIPDPVAAAFANADEPCEPDGALPPHVMEVPLPLPAEPEPTTERTAQYPTEPTLVNGKGLVITNYFGGNC